MKYGFVMPMGDARQVADAAQRAEQAGWDAIFVWEPVWGVDAWVCLTAAAMVTERIRLGTMISPLSRMRPWKMASETATLDNLSGGRVILSVGLGAVDTGFVEFGEQIDRKIRAELLDESLAIITGLWKGQPFAFDGKHYQVKPSSFMVPPPPVQQPRIPIWVVGAWPSVKSMRRVARYDGLLPSAKDEQGRVSGASPQQVAEMKAWIANERGSTDAFDIVVEGLTPGDDVQRAQEIIAPWQAAGATWWLEALWDANQQADGLSQVMRRLEQGPPRA
ncbi:MAG: LLM class flavin-dependent oxidoreductase [Anaerolineae bacterium]|nr:LLM class flavin-dependent oxidoreductase [Anaerolineae bacterium]